MISLLLLYYFLFYCSSNKRKNLIQTHPLSSLVDLRYHGELTILKDKRLRNFEDIPIHSESSYGDKSLVRFVEKPKKKKKTELDALNGNKLPCS